MGKPMHLLERHSSEVGDGEVRDHDDDDDDVFVLFLLFLYFFFLLVLCFILYLPTAELRTVLYRDLI